MHCVCVYESLCVRVCVCVYVSMCACVHENLCMCVRMYVSVCACVLECGGVCIHINLPSGYMMCIHVQHRYTYAVTYVITHA